MSSYTTDSFFDGKIRVMQARRGYRFSIDAVLLAYHAAPRPGEKILDLGTGCGIIALILASRCADLKIYAVEFQAELAELATANVRQNRLEEIISVLPTDMKLLTRQITSGPFDLIVSNPPFYSSGSGRINPDSQRAIARHEIKADLADVLQTTRRMLRTSGRFVTIFSAERTADLLSQMRNENLEPKMIRLIHSNRESDAKLILVEGIKNGRPGLKVVPPLYIYEETGNYTADVQPMFEL
ncbi:tRNA(1)(Val) (adenine(37)-N(6))-methyltransferase (EC [Olavius algarvensis Delta 1 endosymbiont]|nr:tRNA(1)(Val) (adenine(37)-N(6))-methyltransferase (EC [Olavius algarvensis Delta 1 endosymbiont]